MTDPIDIHDPIFELCHRLGLEPTNVAEIIFRPMDVTAKVYKTNSNGAKYYDYESDEVVAETLTFKVKS